MGDPVVVESWHVPRALSDKALRLLTSLPMDEIERRLRVPDLLNRAADPLERQAAAAPVARLPEDAQVIEPANHTILVPVPAPIPVSERLPGPEDCGISAGGYFGSSCWCWNPPSSLGGIGWWSIEPLEWCEGATHWLPAHALPLPEVE